MEKFLNPNDMEYVKLAMLKHEQTFKEQVCELHRLYKIQRILMKNLSTTSKQEQKSGLWDERNATNTSLIDNHDSSTKKTGEVKVLGLEIETNGELEIGDESELELTLGPTNQYRRKKTLETSDSNASFCSSSNGSKWSKSNFCRVMDTPEGNLTGGRKWELEKISSNSNLFSGKKNNSSVVGKQLRGDRHGNPPWLLQAFLT